MARSVFGLAADVTTHKDGRETISLYGGEVDPSADGHDGAGAFSSDIFRFTKQVFPNQKVQIIL